MLVRYYKTLVAVVRSDREGSAYLYGGEEMGLWCMVTLLRNMPARRESEESCPSQVFREIAKKSSNKCKLFWRKTLMWNCLVWTSAVLGIFCSFVFSFVMRRCTFAKCYRMLLFRPDLIIFASQNNWGRKFGDYFGGDKQFSAVDVSRVYSLVIRSAYHIVDINNKPSQGEVRKTTTKTLTTKHLSDFFFCAPQLEDKMLFHKRGTESGLPCVPVIDPRDLAPASDVEFPLFTKPRKLQWGQGVMKLESSEQQEFQDIVREGSDFAEDFVIQKKLENIPQLSEYFPPDAPLCTARITTFFHKGEREGSPGVVRVLESWIRVGASGALADQIENGGSTFAVYAETGVVWNGTTTEKMVLGEPHLEPTLTSAPGATKGIAGHRLPFWQQCLETVREAHMKLAPDAFTVGWDVVFTPTGVQLMEGNLMSMVALHIGMRYGSMALLWPESPLMWLALSGWLLNKDGGLGYTAEAKAKKLRSVASTLRRDIRLAVRERDAARKAVLKLKTGDIEGVASSDKLRGLQTRLMLKEGEVHGMQVELDAVEDALLGGGAAQN